jgi:chemotaxis protein CheZ
MRTEPNAEGVPSTPPAVDPRLEQARALVAHLEAGDETGAERCLDALTRLRETQLFQELGKLTRQLHEALNAFRFDERLAAIAAVEIPDAKERLHYVVQMTEQAASRTLAVVEQIRPRCQVLRQEAESLAQAWQRFLRREMSLEDFRALAARLREFLSLVTDSSAQAHDGLGEVLMAQSFQDLTGQIIKRVIQLVEELEQNLVNLIRLCGQGGARERQPGAAATGETLHGPQIPGRAAADAVSSQDEVDDLLSSLGF